MAKDSSHSDIPKDAPQLRLASGEVVFAQGHGTALENGMLSQQFWLRGDVGAMEAAERPAEWDGEAAWWLVEGDRRAGLLSLLPDLMAWLPLGLDAPRKLLVAEGMAYPGSAYRSHGWHEGDLAVRPFVDAVFADDAAHLHLVDAVAVEGADTLKTCRIWVNDLRMRDLGRHWLRRLAPGARFHAEYDKLCWQNRQSPIDGVGGLIGSRGDEMPERTVEAFWHWVGSRAYSYWGDVPYEQRGAPHHVLVTDGAVPPDEALLELRPYDNVTLACVTPFVLGGTNWLRVDARSWARRLGEHLSPPPNRTIRMAGATDVGKRREANQDAVLWSEKDGWAAVADGMGGHPNGDVASATVLRVFEEAMREWPDAQAPHRRRTVAQRLRQAAAQAHAALWQENKDAGVFGRMGTTLSAVRLHGDELSIVHCGDSRIYMYRPTRGFREETNLHYLTTDHGEGGGLDRAMGLWERMPVDIDTIRIDDKAIYLLCTDGLTNMVMDGKIEQLCREHAGRDGADSDLEGLTRALIDAANEAGGNDNITVCVVEAKERQEDRD